MRSENVSTDQGMKLTPKWKQDLSIESSAHALTKRSRSSVTPLLLRTPMTAHDEKKYSDMGEMGYLHLRVHCLVDLNKRRVYEAGPDLTRVLLSVELVTADYSRKKTIFTKGDITKHPAWGDGLFFRIFQVHVLLYVIVCAHSDDTAR